MSQSVTISTSRCTTCHERSTWEFLGEFYSRVELMSEHSRTLERKLDEAMRFANQSQCALTECEVSLVNSWGTLNEERLQYRACRDALDLERQSHAETIAFLDRVFKETARSAEVGEVLANQVAELRAASNSGTTSAVLPAVLLEEGKAPPKDDTFSCQQVEERAVQPLDFKASEGSDCGVGTTNHIQPIQSVAKSSQTKEKTRSRKRKPGKMIGTSQDK